jgi:Brp/Blh family beta-carotene 15,15'-monooxygenase
MSATRIQGIIFIIIAALVTACCLTLGRLPLQLELIIVSTLILLLGVPHGALDTIFASKLYNINNLEGWIKFTMSYLLLGSIIISLWFYVPSIFLLGFLIISVLHFSGDPTSDVKWLSRLFYGGSIIILPFIYHKTEISRLFEMLVGIKATQSLVPGLQFIAWPWLLGLFASLLIQKEKKTTSYLEILAVTLLAVYAPPLIAFVVFFCCMHSARHIIRAIEYSNKSHLYLLGASLIPMLGVLSCSLLAWLLLKNTRVDTRIVQIVFVGLASLTVPHMLIVEQVRLKDWRKGLIN